MLLLEALFWLSAGAMLYVWAGYPLLLVVWSRLRSRPIRRRDREPAVDLLIAAHDEAEHIEAKLRGCLELDYPTDKLHVVVSLDGPTDGTDRIVARLAAAEPRITVVEADVRGGKAAALNRGMARLRGEVVVLADARQPIERGAIRHLVAALADPEVGSVSGELILVDDDGAETNEGVGIYWRYEKALRRMESEIHSMLGATGALYAVRRSVLAPIPVDTILDDMLVPLRTVIGGQRAVFEPRARVFDRVSDPQWEYRRKVRTLTGNYQLLRLLPELLDPSRNPVFLQFVSHKLGRLAVPWFLIALYLTSAVLPGAFYRSAFAAQTLFYVLALVAPAFTGAQEASGSGTPLAQRKGEKTSAPPRPVEPATPTARAASSGGRT